MQLQITDPSTQASQLVKDSSAPGAGVALSRISFDCCDKYISILLVRRFNKVEKVLYSAHIVVVGVDEISLFFFFPVFSELLYILNNENSTLIVIFRTR